MIFQKFFCFNCLTLYFGMPNSTMTTTFKIKLCFIHHFLSVERLLFFCLKHNYCFWYPLISLRVLFQLDIIFSLRKWSDDVEEVGDFVCVNAFCLEWPGMMVGYHTGQSQVQMLPTNYTNVNRILEYGKCFYKFNTELRKVDSTPYHFRNILQQLAQCA